MPIHDLVRYLNAQFKITLELYIQIYNSFLEENLKKSYVRKYSFIIQDTSYAYSSNDYRSLCKSINLLKMCFGLQ